MGCFSSVLPLRCNMADVADGSFEGLAHRMYDVCRSALRHPDVPLLGIIERLSPPRRAGGGNPLFSTCFSFVSLPRHDSAATAPIPDITSVRFHEAGSSSRLTLNRPTESAR